MLSRGAGSSERLVALAREVAAAEGIPVQIKAYPGETETDADELMAAGNAATLTVGLPMRYMHSPFEVAQPWTTSRRRRAWSPRWRAASAPRRGAADRS